MSLTRPEVLRLLADGKRVRISAGSDSEEFNTRAEFHWQKLWCFVRFTWTEITPPKMVTLGPEDIDLHRDLFRDPEDPDFHMAATGKGLCGVMLRGELRRFNELRDDWQRSIDGGKTWLPCEKEEPYDETQNRNQTHPG